MSTEIDNRVVAMKFDNKQFESGVSTSLSTLGKLKKSLNLEGAAKGLDGVGAAAKRVSFDGMLNGIDAVKVKFSALQVMAVTALANITNSALNAGKNLVSSFTIDPVKDGLKEYETQMNAIQTILANTSTKGTTLKEVNAALAELNTYSDKTIYNFTEMAKNIGTFTAAGIALKPATAAIKGIANLAAVSGSNADQASTAMYQLSQAMASGSVKLMDWNSVVNAGMGGEVFQNSLKETARNHGINIDKMIKREGSFRETLKTGWMSTNILTETLQKFTGDLSASQLKQMGYTKEQIAGIIKMGNMANDAATKVKTFTQLMDTLKEAAGSGWAQTWQIVLGDFEEAKKMFTEISNVLGGIIGASAKARNDMLKGWKDLGGRTVLIDAISIAFNNVMNVLRAVGSAFKEIFPPTTSKQLYAFTVGLKNLMSGLSISKGGLENLKSTFKGLFAVIDIGVDIVKFIADAFGLIIKAIFPVTGSLLTATGGFGDFLVMIHDVIEKSNIFGIALKAVAKVIEFISGIISPYIEKLKTWVRTSTVLENAIAKLTQIFGPYITAIKEWVKTSTLLEDGINGIKNGLIAASAGLGPVLNIIGGVFKDFGLFVKELFTGKNVFAATLRETSNLAESFVQTTEGTNKLTSAFSKLKEVLSNIKDGIIKVFTVIKNFLAPIFDFIKEKISGISMGDIGALLVGGGFLMFANTIRKGLNGVNDILDNFSNVLGEVGKTLKAFQLQVKAKALLTIAIALGVLAAALIALSFIDTKSLAKSLGILSVAFGELVGVMILLNKFGGNNKKIWEKSNISGIVGLGVAMLALAYAVKVLASIDKDKLNESVKALGGMMAMIAIFIITTKSGDLKQSAGGLTAFAIGLLALTGALVILSKLKPETLKQGGIALAGLMGAIAVFILGTRAGDLKASAGGLTAFSIGIAILAGALTVLGKMKPEVLIQGAEAITALMLAIGVFVAGTAGGDLATSAGGITAFAIGIVILAGALTVLGKLDPKVLIQGGEAITVLMLAIAIFVAGTSGGDLAASSAGIIGFAVGLTILTGAIAILAAIDPNKIIQGVGAMVGLIATIGLFVAGTKSGDLLASSAGMIAFSVGLTILSAAVFILASINKDKIIQGVGALAVMIATIGFFVKATNGADLVASGAGLKLFAIGILVLAGALAILSALNANKLMMASASMSAVILSFALFVNVTKGADLVVAAAALIIFSIGIGKLVDSLTSLAALDSKSIIVAAGAISALLLVIAAFTNLTSGGDLVVSSAGLVVFSGAITILALAVKMLGEIPLTTLVTGIGALAAMMVVIGLTAAVVGPLTPVIIALSGAMFLFGIGCLSVAVAALTFGAALTVLAKTGSAGIDTFVLVIRKIVALIPEIMQTLATGVIRFAETIGNGSVVIASAFLKILNSILDTIVVATPKILNTVSVLMTSFLKFLVANVPNMVDAGMKLVIGIVDGISANIGKLIDSAFKLVINFINGLADAINKNSDAINKAVGKLIKSVVDAIGNMVGDMHEAGVNAVKGFINGLGSMISDLWDAGKKLGKSALDSAKQALGIHSPSKKFKDEVGVMIGKGMAEGIKKSSPEVETAATRMANSVLDATRKFIDDRKYYNKISLEEELYVWQQIQNKYKAGTAARLEADKEVYRVRQEMADKTKADAEAKKQKQEDADSEAFAKSKRILEDKKYYNQLTLKEEYDGWLAIQKQYKEGTDQRIEADKEVYRLKNELITKEEDHAKEILAIENDTNDKRKAIQDDYYAKTKEVKDKQVADIEALNKTYNDAVDSRTQTLYNSYGLFDSVSSPKKTSGAKLIKNLQDQAKEFASWQTNLQGLSQKGISSGLLDELKAMGPKSVSEIKALNELSTPELNTYVSLWQSKHDQAKTQAVSELEGLRTETLTKIDQINADSKTALDGLKTTWSNQMKALNDDSKTQLDALKAEWLGTVGTITSTADTQVTTMGDDIKTTVATVRTDTETEFTTLAENIQTIMTKPNWVSIGENIVLGIKQGATNKSTELANEVSRIALLALTSAKTTLGIKSPSRAFAEVGAFCGEGFIIGLSGYGSKVANTATNVGSGAVNAMSNAISAVSDAVNSNIDSQPVIRPVLDLSDVISGANTLGSMFDKNQSISAIASSMQRSKSGQEQVIKTTSINANGTNNQNGFNLSIENFVNNRTQDIENLATEFAFYMKQKQMGGSR